MEVWICSLCASFSRLCSLRTVGISAYRIATTKGIQLIYSIIRQCFLRGIFATNMGRIIHPILFDDILSQSLQDRQKLGSIGSHTLPLLNRTNLYNIRKYFRCLYFYQKIAIIKIYLGRKLESNSNCCTS